MDRHRRGVLAGVAAALLGSGCLSREQSPGADALAATLGDTGATDTGELWVSLTVENTAAAPAEGTCYVHAVEPGETHTEARYFELAGGESVTERVVFPDVSHDAFWEGDGYVQANVA